MAFLSNATGRDRRSGGPTNASMEAILLALAINQEIKDLFGRQGSVSISYLSREVLIRDLLVLVQRWLRGRIQ